MLLKQKKLLLAMSFGLMISLSGCGKTDEVIKDDSISSEAASNDSIDATINDDKEVIEEKTEDASESEKGKIEIGEEMRLEEVKETNTDNIIEPIGDVIRLYIVFDSGSSESDLEVEINKLEELLSADSNFKVRRRDEANNAVVIVITDTSYELVTKQSSIKEISILEEAGLTTNGTVSK